MSAGMRMMMRLMLLWLVCGSALAAGGGGPELMDANVNLGNKTSLQRGAKMFVNYCLSCHSAQYMRYNRMAEDLGLEIDAVEDNLMFASDKVGDTMNIAMDPKDSTAWFGVAPPDLSVVARSRGADWLYSFLNGFYEDDSKPTGVNNAYFVGTAMPHVLWELQGMRKLVEHDAEHDDGHGGGNKPHFETVQPGKLSEGEYQQATRDLVSFLVYMGEPAKLVRYRIGFWVIVFLSVLFVATYLLKREYWKDVH